MKLASDSLSISRKFLGKMDRPCNCCWCKLPDWSLLWLVVCLDL